MCETMTGKEEKGVEGTEGVCWFFLCVKRWKYEVSCFLVLKKEITHLNSAVALRLI